MKVSGFCTRSTVDCKLLKCRSAGLWYAETVTNSEEVVDFTVMSTEGGRVITESAGKAAPTHQHGPLTRRGPSVQNKIEK